jgi:hypothetical protein
MKPVAAAVAPSRPAAPAELRDGIFRRSMSTSPDERLYRDVPVDWWDRACQVWRPTSVLQALPSVNGERRRAEILAPEHSGVTVAAVDIADLRVSRLLTAGVARYWSRRYRRLLLLTLLEHSDGDRECAPYLHVLHDALQAAELLARDVWVTAFRTGQCSPVAVMDGCVSDWFEPAREWSPQATHGPLPIAETVVPLLACDFRRLHDALRAAALPQPAVMRHPLVLTVDSLLRSAISLC